MVYCFKTAISFFTTVALVYGTGVLIFKPLAFLATKLGRSDYSSDTSKLAEFLAWPSTILASPHENGQVLESLTYNSGLTGESGQHPSHSIQEDPLFLRESVFLSRAFSQAMKPSKIIPFYYRASRSFMREDITIATLVTSNRFEVLVGLVQRYQGPVSVAIHITDAAPRNVALLQALHELYTGTPHLAEYLDVHLVLDVFERQFNTWRNIARFFAAQRTDFVMMLDVDFALCTDFRARIQDSAQSEVMNKVRQGAAALVIPAFEFTNFEDGLNQSAFPRTKRELLSLVHEGRVGMFHAAWQPGHNITNYRRYYTASPGEVYKVVGYQQAYEPYVIFKNAGTPWCDERFIGYGGNKAACLFELYLSGIDFFVLSDDFIIHQSHAYAEQARKQERKYNRKTYAEYREETCLRYLRYFLSDDKMDTIRGHNLQLECRKVKGFARVAAEASSRHISNDNSFPW